MNIQVVDIERINSVLATREPRGLFLYVGDGQYIGVDNSEGEAWTEEFKSEALCRIWLTSDDMSAEDVQELEENIEEPTSEVTGERQETSDETKLYRLYDSLDEDGDDLGTSTLQGLRDWLSDFWVNNPDDGMSDETLKELVEDIQASDESELFDRLCGIGYHFEEVEVKDVLTSLIIELEDALDFMETLEPQDDEDEDRRDRKRELIAIANNFLTEAM